MDFVIFNGNEEISIENTNFKNIGELKKNLNEKVKDEDFWLEQFGKNGEKIEDDQKLTEIKNNLKVCYKKKFCDFQKCKLKRCLISGNCRFCLFHYCAKHKMPEEHTCSNFNLCKKEANDKNASLLESGRVEQNKL
ncbi:putative Zinc finger, AN1-type protein [Pseudoloma neurophilia]|uniref:Putative Zinc finger, AN1-type protein n=1 Tax=Pseudoloma neurophilia TaxID=146866 RepID=A0A0R0M0D5_9MICR|nr:putative Zinc finger, AN1-type protein [Pseudoloma neurophilia]